ncbi:MAG: hypothetical protein HOQ43_04405 [Glycomyces artemisiae]|uniref:Uncharacterized protein n=1 Tax=Glycomyces artemisiae TaxID=1076443 RepID=A0A850C0R4_9ACTN|nr:hypothetical protein [Glycomyces artemisiae]
MTDDWDAAADDVEDGAEGGSEDAAAGGADSAEDGFGDDFFADLESAPGTSTAADDLFAADGPDEYSYEAESDGTFETAASDPADTVDTATGDVDSPASDSAAFDDADFPFDLDFDVGGEG